MLGVARVPPVEKLAVVRHRLYLRRLLLRLLRLPLLPCLLSRALHACYLRFVLEAYDTGRETISMVTVALPWRNMPISMAA